MYTSVPALEYLVMIYTVLIIFKSSGFGTPKFWSNLGLVPTLFSELIIFVLM